MSNDELQSQHPLRGQIYWADLEPVKGSEQGGSRPVLIMSNDLMNQKAEIVLILPITRPGEVTKHYPFNVAFNNSDWEIDNNAITELRKKGHNFAGVGGYILCNQVRAFSKKRLLTKIGELINDQLLLQAEVALKDSLGFTICSSCNTPLRPGSLKCRCGKRHSVKCSCKKINPIHYKHCPDCGRRL